MLRIKNDVLQGFTLIEMMIVVAMVAILAAIAVPNYRQYVLRSNRAEAISTMLEAANWMQRNYTINNSYIGATTATLAAAGLGQSPKTGTAKYNLNLTAASTTATGFALNAVPVATELKCGTFTLDQSGTRTVTGTATSSDCWGGR